MMLVPGRLGSLFAAPVLFPHTSDNSEANTKACHRVPCLAIAAPSLMLTPPDRGKFDRRAPVAE